MKTPPRPRRRPASSDTSSGSQQDARTGGQSPVASAPVSRPVAAKTDSLVVATGGDASLGESVKDPRALRVEERRAREEARAKRARERDSRAPRTEGEAEVRGKEAPARGRWTAWAGTPRRERKDRVEGEEATPRPSRERVRAGQLLRRPVGQAEAAVLLGSHEDAPAADLKERREERAQARRRLFWTRLLRVLGAGALTLGVVWVVFFSSIFSLEASRVQVEGVDGTDLSAQEVSAAVTPYVGIPLTRLSMSALQNGVEQVHLVRSATVTRSWPTGVNIQVRVRQAIMGHKTSGHWDLLDEQGVVVGQADSLPEGFAPVTIPEGEGAQGAAEAVSAVWNALAPEVRNAVMDIAHDGQTITLSLTGSRVVKWGIAGETELKAKVVAVLLRERGARVYDVSSPVHPVTS